MLRCFLKTKIMKIFCGVMCSDASDGVMCSDASEGVMCSDAS